MREGTLLMSIARLSNRLSDQQNFYIWLDWLRAMDANAWANKNLDTSAQKKRTDLPRPAGAMAPVQVA